MSLFKIFFGLTLSLGHLYCTLALYNQQKKKSRRVMAPSTTIFGFFFICLLSDNSLFHVHSISFEDCKLLC